MKNTKIEWCDHTVNLWWGCDKVSEACENCYAEAMAKRFGKDCFGVGKERWLRLEKAAIEIEKLNRSAQKRGVVETVFINSMSDFFDKKVITDIRFWAWSKFSNAENLVFLILTKRATFMANQLRSWSVFIPDNVHFGITAENQQRLNERMTVLKDFKGKVFLSVEPMLGPIDISKYVDYIDWVICGGESGHKARPFQEKWAIDLRIQCEQNRIPFFYKQDGKNFINAGVLHSLEGAITRNTKQFPAWHPKGGVK